MSALEAQEAAVMEVYNRFETPPTVGEVFRITKNSNPNIGLGYNRTKEILSAYNVIFGKRGYSGSSTDEEQPQKKYRKNNASNLAAHRVNSNRYLIESDSDSED